jgi:hypothetical protein
LREKIVIMILMLAVASLMVNKGGAYYTLTVYVDPPKNNVNVDSTFTVNVKLLNGVDVFVEQFFLYWYVPALSVVSYQEGDFLSQGVSGTTSPVFKVSNESGYFKFWDVRLGQKIGGVSGSGIMASVTFLVKSTASTGLYLSEIHIGNELGQELTLGFVRDGYVNVNPPMFHVAPSSVTDPTLKPGVNDHFTLNLTLTNVVNATGFQFTLYYNNTLLNATQLQVVPFLKAPITVDTRINNTQSFLWVNLTSSDPIGVTGSGTVANVTFQVLAIGQTLLKLNVTNLDDSLAKLGSPAFQNRPLTEDGYFSNIPAGHDVKVYKITALPTTLDVGGTVTINATIINLGAFNETVYVAASYGTANLIGNQTGIRILTLESKSIIFSWNTAGVAAGSYTITVRVGNVTDETTPSNNVATFAPIVLNSSQSSNLYLYIGAGIAVAAVVIILALYFLRFRKPKPKAAKT